MLKGSSIILLVIFVTLAYRFWFGQDSLVQVVKLRRTLQRQDVELATLKQRNQLIIDQINNLKASPMAIEEQARYELGMVKRGEKYYQVVEPID
jgi:cell division protein FtsB